MGGGTNRRGHTNSKIIHQYPLLIDICTSHQWMGFFDRIKGYDDEIAHEFDKALQPWGEDSATTIERGIVIHFNV